LTFCAPVQVTTCHPAACTCSRSWWLCEGAIVLKGWCLLRQKYFLVIPANEVWGEWHDRLFFNFLASVFIAPLLIWVYCVITLQASGFGDESLVYLLFRYSECTFYSLIVLSLYDWTSWDTLWEWSMWSISCAMHRPRTEWRSGGVEIGTLLLTAVVVFRTRIFVVGWLCMPMPIWSGSIRGRSSTIVCLFHLVTIIQY
jgi:hypothetical protein